MASLRLTLCAAALCLVAASKVQNVVLRKARAQSFVQAVDVNHRLRVCNAYPFSGALDILIGQKKLTQDGPMRYKSCQDFQAPRQVGDRLDFKIGDAKTGTFSVSDLPGSDATLLLVVYRHDTRTTAVAFESHVFATLGNAQVAVIDTFTGKAVMKPKIQDMEAKGKPHFEDLSFGTVVAINPGKYKLLLEDAAGAETSNEMVAVDRENYVVLRVGVDAKFGPSFPQELVVFPKTEESALADLKSAQADLKSKLEVKPEAKIADALKAKSGATTARPACLSALLAMAVISWVH